MTVPAFTNTVMFGVLACDTSSGVPAPGRIPGRPFSAVESPMIAAREVIPDRNSAGVNVSPAAYPWNVVTTLVAMSPHQ
jgi:hypothetical protein